MTKLILVVIAFVIGGIVVSVVSVPQVEYVKEYQAAPTLEELTSKRVSEIIASPEFQEEMNTIATARALYQLSIENQDVAVELSEKAMFSFQRSKEMAEKWTDKTLNINND